MVFNRKIQIFLVIFWLTFFVAAFYLYFFQPQIFYRMTQYGGPGGPFVNTPRG